MALGTNLAKKNIFIKIVRQTMVWVLLYYLRFWAKVVLWFFHGTIIGIAGAVGKSTTRNALSAILSSHQATKVVSGNSETGIPLGLLGLEIGTYSSVDLAKAILLAPFRILHLRPYVFLIVEMGIDGPKPPKNMSYLLTIIHPQIAIWTNESPAHVSNYESEMGLGTVDERLARVVTNMTDDDGKLLLNPAIQTVIINGDDPAIRAFTNKLSQQMVRTVGIEKNHDVSLSHHTVDTHGTTFELSVHSFQMKEDVRLTFPNMVLPEETAIALSASIVTALSLSVPLPVIINNLTANFVLPPGRGSMFKGIHDSNIFDSSYNASSASVISFLRVMKSFKQTTRYPTFAILGDMKELGSFSDYEHGLVAKELPGSVDHVILVGPLTKELMLPSLSKHADKFKTLLHFQSSQEVGEYLTTHLPEKSIVLFKGSQLLEEAIKYILADKADAKKLCRQDAFWEKTKKLRHQWTY